MNSGERAGYSQVVDVFREFPDVQWYVLGDDDTLFLPPNLNTLLASRDPEQDWYIGQVSEVAGQVEQFGEMAYGGGGFVLSHKTMSRLEPEFEDFLKRNRHMYGGDERIGKCLISEMSVNLTPHAGFHQLDVDALDENGWEASYFSWLETNAGVPTISLHHLEALARHLPSHFSADAMAHAARNSPATFLRKSAAASERYGAFAITHAFTVRWFQPLKVGLISEVELLDNSKYQSYRHPHARYLLAASHRVHTSKDSRDADPKGLLSLRLVSKYAVMVPHGHEVGGICEGGSIIKDYPRNATMHSIQIHHPLPMGAQRLCCIDMKMRCWDDRAHLDIWMDECNNSSKSKHLM
ncbi:hypothetical protein WJX72_011491 [[Myrmecia] bisecta]|uniref:Uncharacterized protein n=1 Tax=[Myrmecia] bisecta TaxID=41462 RepID=A0AAW1PD76_9CHLO